MSDCDLESGQISDPTADRLSAPNDLPLVVSQIEGQAQTAPRKRRSRVNEKCLFCGGPPEPCFQYQLKDQRWTAWNDDCGASLCSVLSLPDVPFRDAFAYGPYCTLCARILRDLNFAVKQVAALQAKISRMKSLVEEKIADHHRRVQKTTYFAEPSVDKNTKVFCSTKPKNLRYRAKLLEMITNRLTDNTRKCDRDRDSDQPKKIELEIDSDAEDNASDQHLDMDSLSNHSSCADDPGLNMKSEHFPMEELSPKTKSLLGVEKFENADCANPEGPEARCIHSPTRSRSQKSMKGGGKFQISPRKSERRSRMIAGEREDSEENQEPEFILPDVIDEGIAEGQEEKPQPNHSVSSVPVCQTHLKKEVTKRNRKGKKSKHKKKTPGKRRKGPSQFPCDLCPHVSISQRAWDDHNRASHPGRRFECEVCGMGFRMLLTLQAHLRNVHSGLRFAHYCSTCKKGFDRETELHEHEVFHVSDTPFRCSECQAVFTNSNDLERHVRTHENPYKCAQCFRSFSTPEYLQQHMSHHERTVQCDICGLPCISEARLKSHLQAHSSAKEFQCDLCPLSYKYKKGLIVHMRTHTGERPFACKMCDRTFYSAGHLKRHEEIHSGTRTYVCQTCGKAFQAQNNLKQHERCVHRIGKPPKKRAPRPKVRKGKEADGHGGPGAEIVVAESHVL